MAAAASESKRGQWQLPRTAKDQAVLEMPWCEYALIRRIAAAAVAAHKVPFNNAIAANDHTELAMPRGSKFWVSNPACKTDTVAVNQRSSATRRLSGHFAIRFRAVDALTASS